MIYGPKIGDVTIELYNRAIAQDTLNPRALYLKAQFEMGSAKFFNKDLTPYCSKIEKAIILFGTFKPKSEIHPVWGKKLAQNIIDDVCGNN